MRAFLITNWISWNQRDRKKNVVILQVWAIQIKTIDEIKTLSLKKKRNIVPLSDCRTWTHFVCYFLFFVAFFPSVANKQNETIHMLIAFNSDLMTIPRIYLIKSIQELFECHWSIWCAAYVLYDFNLQVNRLISVLTWQFAWGSSDFGDAFLMTLYLNNYELFDNIYQNWL